MKAIVYTEYGSPDALELKDLEVPVPGEGEVLIKVHAASVNASDLHFLAGKPFVIRMMSGLRNPKFHILGTDIAGRVEAIGDNVTRFQVGDDVFGDIFDCGLGGFAEYVCVSADALVSKPASMSFETAAAIPMAAVTALHALCDMGRIESGKKVLINGASGGVGSFAVQIAKSYGAEVTGVCSTAKVDMVRSLGADYVIDYAQEDFTKSGQGYDLIFAANGYHPILDYRRALNPEGIYVMTGGTGAQMFEAMLLGPLISIIGRRKIGNLLSNPDTEALAVLTRLVEAGKVTPVIDKCFPLSEVADAMRLLGTGHVQGKLVISMVSGE